MAEHDVNNKATINTFIDNLTAKFAAAQKSAGFIGQNSQVGGWTTPDPDNPGTSINVNQVDRNPTPGVGFVTPGFRYSTPVMDAPMTWPGALPTSDIGNYITGSSFLGGAGTPRDYEMYAQVPGSSDYLATLINMGLTGGAYAGLAAGAGMGANYGSYLFNRPGGLFRSGEAYVPKNVPFLGSIKDLSIPQLEDLIQARAKGNIDTVRLQGTGAVSDKILNNQARLAEFMHLNSQFGINPQEYKVFKYLQEASGNSKFTFNDYVAIAKHTSDAGLQAEFAQLRAVNPSLTPAMYAHFKSRQANPKRGDTYKFEHFLDDLHSGAARHDPAKNYFETAGRKQLNISATPIPRPDPLALTGVDIDLKGGSKAKPSTRSVHINPQGRTFSTRGQRIGIPKIGKIPIPIPALSAGLGAGAVVGSNYGNYNQLAPELIPLTSTAPGVATPAPLDDSSIRRFEDRARQTGQTVERRPWDSSIF